MTSTAPPLHPLNERHAPVLHRYQLPAQGHTTRIDEIRQGMVRLRQRWIRPELWKINRDELSLLFWQHAITKRPPSYLFSRSHLHIRDTVVQE